MENKTYVVLGLGIFGSTMVKELCNYNQEVIAIDKDMASVERVSAYCSNCFGLDFTDKEALRNVGVENCDVGIVACGEHLEETILAILNLKDLGVKNIIAKSKNKRHGEILTKIGADNVVTPEKETAKLYAKSIITKDIHDLFDLDDKTSIYEMDVKPEWVNHSLIELDLRRKENVNVIGIRRNGNLILNINPNDKLNNDDELIVVGNSDLIKE